MVIPNPHVPPDDEDLNKQRLRFRLEHFPRKGKNSLRSCDEKARKKICKKIRYLARRPLHEFKTGAAKPRKWREKLKFQTPQEISKDIKDNLADYFNIDGKIRVFGYLMEREFIVLAVTTDHSHSK